jgi:hypothetical protein
MQKSGKITRTTGENMYYSVYFKDEESAWMGQINDNGEIDTFIPLDINNESVVPYTLYYSIVEENGDDFTITNIDFKPIDPEFIGNDAEIFELANSMLNYFKSKKLH